MESHGPAAEALSYPRVPARSVLTPGVRLTESPAKAPAESELMALPQRHRGNIRNIYSIRKTERGNWYTAMNQWKAPTAWETGPCPRMVNRDYKCMEEELCQ